MTNWIDRAGSFFAGLALAAAIVLIVLWLVPIARSAENENWRAALGLPQPVTQPWTPALDGTDWWSAPLCNGGEYYAVNRGELVCMMAAKLCHTPGSDQMMWCEELPEGGKK